MYLITKAKDDPRCLKVEGQERSFAIGLKHNGMFVVIIILAKLIVCTRSKHS